MKLPFLLIFFVLPSLTMIAAPALTRSGEGYGGYPPAIGGYGGEPSPYDGYPTAYGAPETDFRDSRDVRGRAQGWIPDHYQAPLPEQYPDPALTGAHGDYPGPRDRSPYQLFGSGDTRVPGVWGGSPLAEPVMPGGLPRSALRGYRFRGDEDDENGNRGSAPWGGGFRFRPLTEKERARRQQETGWRPLDPARTGGRPRRPSRFPEEEAYGYQSDDWFRRYYGDRP